MRLLIISHMPHHMRGEQVVGWGATVRELDQLATRFESVRHIACLHPGSAPASAIPYAAQNIELVPVPPSGADGFLGKLDVLRVSPQYIKAILRELPRADVVHVRGPAHIALIAMLMLSLRRQPVARWFKYAGNWRPQRRDNPSYGFQRWWLAHRWHRGYVTVNGEWPDQPPWILPFYNPSLDETDVADGAAVAATKQLTSPLRLVFVGVVSAAKGAGRALEILARLRDRGLTSELEIVGGGPELAHFEETSNELGISELVHFAGWQPPNAVHAAYARAHVQLLPSASEGWPKVLSEGMAYGVVPLAAAVSAIPQYLTELATGHAFPVDDLDAFVDAIANYVASPDMWKLESRRAAEAARLFTFGTYLAAVDALLADLPMGAR